MITGRPASGSRPEVVRAPLVWSGSVRTTVFLGEVDVMPAFRFSLGKYRLAALTFVLIASLAGSVQAQGDEDDWHPESSFEGKFDWIQMTSGEWLKGEIIAMYDEELEW
jgi:hypothetical protein